MKSTVKSFRHAMKPFLLMIQMTVCLFALMSVKGTEAAFHEQMAICTRSIALANTCTADPPGVMAIHYNPAGLSDLPDGKTFSQGLTLPVILMTVSLDADPNAKKFLDGSSPNLGPWNPGGDGDNNGNYDKQDPLAGTKGTSGPLMYVPIYNDTIPFLIAPTMGLSTRNPGSKWTFAIGSYAPFAVGLTHDEPDDPIRYGAKAVGQQHLIYASPTASYRVNDELSLGISIGLGQTATNAQIDMRSPSDMLALTRVLGESTEGLEIPIISQLTLPSPWFNGGVAPYDKVAQLDLKLRDDFSPSYNLGVLWSPKQWVSLGLCYQSEIKVEQTGRYSIQHSPQFSAMMDWLKQGMMLPVTAAMLNLPTSGEDQYGYCSSSSFTYPQRIQAGIKFRPLDQIKFLFDLHWAEWSVIKEDRFIFDQDISLLRFVNLMGYPEPPDQMVMNRNFEDTLHWSSAIEILPTDWLTFRFGYEMRPTSVQPELYDALYALPDLENYGAGVGIKLDNGVELDFAFAYIFNNEYKVLNGTSSQMNSDDWTKPVYNPFVGLDYTQETKVYIYSGNATMPIDVMVDMTKHGIESTKNFFGKLNPF